VHAIITDGCSPATSVRANAHTIGENRSGEHSAQDGTACMIRMTISVCCGQEPAKSGAIDRFDRRGLLMQTNRSWSIDDKRYNFQFGCEIGWEIRTASASGW